ncbi:response regulator [Alkalimonas amylolytica]|uniref:Two-component system, chemotaxis family, response regulator CheY n=1 Tax=Alkalimonas amylolytica TaxID=152573 RepID=A0A1H4D2D0_ALKAM|nr:response regulator [Alkalimonas amylolytica]SEA66696.1 two-component system, chemotaxis family, response regulator CheY [Alkalimonas amylolytica]
MQLSTQDLDILLAEPSDVQRKIIRQKLKAEDVHQVAEAASLQQAISAIRQHRPDAIASALHFADGTALELLQQLKTEPATADIPFLLVSSETRKEQLEAFKQSGVIAILPKPFDAEQLGKALNAAIDYISPSELELDLFDVQDVRVLIVDDSRLARNHIRRVLQNLGMQHISEADDGKAAMEFMQQQLVDLVVTDYNMPEVNGEELTRFIREHSTLSHIPILMVTSEANDAHLANIAQSGINALCDKPFEPAAVKELLYRILGQD